ncbi:AmpG family muropeptide MFS transporter [Psychrosphaera aestuarii]|uniref:AmpG family muropeptide MFS transporter n=1 Tax=Psychrosphaera aestuarii TaxID=1266052 RepID=UPI001B32C830
MQFLSTTLSGQSLIQLLNSFKIYFELSVLRLFAFGFAAGLPIMLVFSSLSFWLREAGAARSSIGFFSWVTLAYAMKWIWAPAVDKVKIPVLSRLLGRRKSWLFLTQIFLVASIAAMALTDPKQNLYAMALAAVAVAFFSATQDVVIDAFRIESGDDRQQAAMAAAYMIGYRLAMIVATAGVLYITALFEVSANYDYSAWQSSYLIMSGIMALLIAFTVSAPEPIEYKNEIASSSHQSILQKVKSAFVNPVIDLIVRYKSHAILLIILIATYRISDIVMGVMANVFYVDMGYTKQEIAAISKIFGVVMTLVGAFVCGGLINRFGILPILLTGAILSALTNLLFVMLSKSSHNLELLTLVISIDNLSAGIAMAALIAFLSSLTNKEFTATQYAWLSSAMLLLPKSLGGFSGVWLEKLGYSQFFTMTACIGIPAIIALLVLMKKKWHA